MTEADGMAPAEVRVVNDAESLKALADPLRLRILHTVMGDPHRAWTVKEIAAALDQPVTKLYHHVKQLEQASLIRDVETRVVSGIVEHRYRSGQLSLQFDERLFGSPATRDASIQQAAALIDESRDDLVAYLAQPEADVEPVLLSRAQVRLTPQELAEVNARIGELIDGFRKNRNDPDRADATRVSMLFVAHPQARRAE